MTADELDRAHELLELAIDLIATGNCHPSTAVWAAGTRPPGHAPVVLQHVLNLENTLFPPEPFSWAALRSTPENRIARLQVVLAEISRRRACISQT